MNPTAHSPAGEPTLRPSTVGALRASGHVQRTVKAELRENLLRLMRSGAPGFPGVVGFDDTVLPDLERALLAGHDVVLLGERGQGKTRLIRTLVGLLDEWTPVIAGAGSNSGTCSTSSVKAGPRNGPVATWRRAAK